MRCTTCGTQFSPGQQRCLQCGEAVGGPETQNQPQPRMSMPSQMPPPTPPNRTPSYPAQTSPSSMSAPLTRFCGGCGQGLVATAVVCPYCGTGAAAYGVGAKSKTTSVLLAVFLGPWAWLNTYKRDSVKFWIGLVVGGLLAIPTFFISWSAVHLWAIIDVCIKPESYYTNFPNG